MNGGTRFPQESGALRGVAPRGRVKSADLASGDCYFCVWTPTGVCCFKTRSEDEAQELVARNPDRLSYTGHTR